MLGLLSSLFQNTAAASNSPWLEAGDPVLNDLGEVPTGTPLPQTLTGYGNVDCVDHTFVTRPAIFEPLQQEISYSACAVETTFGWVDPNGYIELNGTRIAGKIQTHTGSNVLVTPVPDSSTLAVSTYTPNGFKLRFHENISHLNLTIIKSLNGEITYRLPPEHRYLQDSSGKHMYIRPETITFSANGKWMVVESEYVAKLLVNLETFTIVPFAGPFAYHIGIHPTAHYAVDNTGRYVITTSRAGHFTITDISSCPPPPDAINGPVDCASKSYQPFMMSLQTGYQRIMQPRFLSSGLLRFYIHYKPDPTTNIRTKYKMVPPGEMIENLDYVALGDSYTSGEGAWDYFPGTDKYGNNCRSSVYSYPYLIGQKLELDSYHNVACAGAKIENIAQYTQKTETVDPNPLGEWLPGYQPQIDYINRHDTDVVTISVGGNDIGFSSILNACIDYGIFPTTCYNDYESRKALVLEIQKNFAKLSGSIRMIREAMNDSGKLYVIGYPRLAVNKGNCAINVRLNSKEIRFSNQIIDYLNETIKRAAMREGVYYVDIKNAFVGYRLCETASEGVAVHGATAGKDIPDSFGIVAGESFHPKKLGHRLLMRKILRKTNYFQAQMPAPDPATEAPSTTDDIPLLRDYAQTTNMVNSNHAQHISNDSITRGQPLDISISGAEFALAPNSEFSIELHSDPTSLGLVLADENGDIAKSVTIPDDVEPGVHTLHVLGTNIVGEQIDIYKTVYVAYSDDNYDGDQFLNHVDKCLIIDVKIDGIPRNRQCHIRIESSNS